MNEFLNQFNDEAQSLGMIVAGYQRKSQYGWVSVDEDHIEFYRSHEQEIRALFAYAKD